MVQYILECISFQLVFLIMYDLFLKRETFFQWNRAYLIGTYGLSMVLPWVKIEAMKTTVPQSFQAYPEFLWGLNDAVAPVIAEGQTPFSISWEYALLYGGMLLATFLFGYKLYRIFTLRRQGDIRYFNDFTRVIVANSAMAFSFFRSIFLGDKVIEKEHRSIVAHELVHIRQGHSYDLMFFEIMRIVGWFNPLVYVYQSRLSELHEYIADAQVAKTNKKEQYEFLLSQVFQTQNISFINQFFKPSLIKKRIVMLSKNKSKNIWQLKYLLLIPVLAGMLFYTSLEGQEIRSMSKEAVSEDLRLIEQIEKEVLANFENLNSATEIMQYYPQLISPRSQSTLLSKEDYFRQHIVFKTIMENLEPVVFGDDVAPRPPLPEHPLPSTASYELYVQNEKAFQFLDANLRLSFTDPANKIALGIRLVDKNHVHSNDWEVFNVFGVDNLTGDELRAFNQKIDDIFQAGKANLNGLILTDGRYTFEIFEAETLINNAQKNAYKEPIKKNDLFDKYLNKEPELILDSNNLKDQYDQLVDERARLIKSANEENPVIVELDRQLKSLEMALEQEIEQVPFAKVDKAPVFPGCEGADDTRSCFNEKMQRHIMKHFRYPEEAQRKGIQGRVSILLTIDDAGRITKIKKRGPDALLEDEAERIIRRLPKMTPGMHKGRVVKVLYSIPITFKLHADKDSTSTKSLLKGINEDDPLVFIDGKEASKKELEELEKSNVESIETIYILKNEAAVNKYGAKGKNGVIEVTTKKMP